MQEFSLFSSPTSTGQSLRHERAWLLVRALPFMLATELLAAGIIAALFLSQHANKLGLSVWFIAVCIGVFWRLGLTHRLRRQLLKPHADSLPISQQLVGICLTGALFFALITVLLVPSWPAGGNPTLWLFGALLLGLTILGGSAYAADFKIGCGYVLVLALPPALLLILGAIHGARLHAALPVPLLVAVLLIGCYRIYQLITKSLAAELRNRSLIQFLEGARSDAERLNDKLTAEMAKRHQARLQLQQAKNNLEQLVDERTRELRATSQRLELALATSGIAMWDWDLIRNQAFQSNITDLLGYTPNTFNQSAQAAKVIHPDDFAATHATLIDHLKGKTPAYRSIYRIQHADGDWRWIEDHGQVVARDDRGRAQRMIGTRRDISDVHEADAQSRLAATVFENASEGIFIFDTRLDFLAVNASFSHITGYTEAELIGRSVLANQDRRQQPAYNSIYRQLLEEGFWEGELIEYRKDGSSYPEWLRIKAVYNSHQQLTHYVGMISDLTERKRNAERLQFLSDHDPLTGLANRIRFGEILHRRLINASLSHTRLALLCVNINRFKPINDSLGHDSGDQVLQLCAQRLLASVADNEQVARIDGNEFALLLPYKDNLEVEHFCQQLIDHLHAPLQLEHQELLLDTSVGVSLFPDHGGNVRTLLCCADSAMHRAKYMGGNNFCYYNAGMSTATREQLSLETHLKKALERNQFEVYYQPKMQLANGCINGVEALVRWHHPERGLLSPGHFIPLAEKTGLITDLGEWVLFEACRQAAAWQRQGATSLVTSVNLSAQQFRHCDLVALVKQALSDSGLAAHQLQLELTETLLMDDLERNINTLQRLRQLGVGLSLDDFGTGYSSLSYLRRFPINELKIDRAFIIDMETNPEAHAITAAIISMAHSLNLQVVAEGIETSQQRARLHAMHCDAIQGYLIGKPMPAAQLQQLLALKPHKIHTSA